MTINTDSSVQYHFDGESLYNAIEMRDIHVISDILAECPDLVTKPYDFTEFTRYDLVCDYCEKYPLYHAWSVAYDTYSDCPLEIVNILLPYSDIFETNNQVQNLLHVAAFTGEFEIAKYAILNGVCVNDIDVNGNIPIQYTINNYTICDLIYKNRD